MALQALLLVPSFARAGLGRLRLHWEPGHEAVRTVMRLGLWTFGFVVANQVALFVVLALAVGAKGDATVSAYTYAYTFMQMPYAVVAVSVMSAVTPDLSRLWALGDVAAFRRRFSGGLRAVLSIILPASVGNAAPGQAGDRAPARSRRGHGRVRRPTPAPRSPSSPPDCRGSAASCSWFARCSRCSGQRSAFWLYLVENGINIVLAVALVHSMSVRGLAVSLSVAYTSRPCSE